MKKIENNSNKAAKKSIIKSTFITKITTKHLMSPLLGIIIGGVIGHLSSNFIKNKEIKFLEENDFKNKIIIQLIDKCISKKEKEIILKELLKERLPELMIFTHDSKFINELNNKATKIIEKGFTIIQPLSNSKIPHACPVIGKVKQYDRNKIYRIVVYPLSLKNYHPSSGPVIFKDGNFKATAYVGAADGSSGEEFDILIVKTNKIGSKIFDDYIIDAAKYSNWAGIGSLPENTKEVARIRVVRK